MRIRSIFLLSLLLLLSGGVSAFAQYDRTTFYYRGRQALMEGRYSTAIDNFNILLRLDEKQYEAYFYRGIAKYNLGDFIGAGRDFDTALEINPLYTSAYHYRAITLSRSGKYEQALQDLKEAVDLRPDFPGLYFSRGVTYFLAQQFDLAIKDFNRFLRSESREPDAYLNRGACYLFTGDTLKALSDYDKAITLNAFEPEGYIRRSRVYYQQGRLSDALGDLDKAIELDTTNTLAFFNRALIRYDAKNIRGAISDLDRVLKAEPDNSLTLYNRALILAQTGALNRALDDLDRVLEINPNNVLAYFNRASVFIELGRYRDALNDYSKAIALYPDFAKAYMNRSYVKRKLGEVSSAHEDYEIAQEKVRQYQVSQAAGSADFADTTKKYNSLLALDAEFARKDFNDEELLQYRNIDIRLKPMFRFTAVSGDSDTRIPMILHHHYENDRMERFMASVPMKVELSSKEMSSARRLDSRTMETIDKALKKGRTSELLFAKAILEADDKQFNAAVACYTEALEKDPGKMFYYLNRGVLQSDMIDFISSMESNVQVLSMDNSGTARTRVRDKSMKTYDYSAAIADMRKAADLMPDFPFTYYNLGNLYCMSNELPQAIQAYTAALEKYPWMGEAYYNRGLVQIYLKDREKGCIDLSKAGELGIPDAYTVIKKYCVQEQE